MIIGHDTMVQIGLMAEFKCQVIQWDGSTVHTKDTKNLIGKSDLTKRKMREVVIQTSEPASTQESTDQMVKYLTVPMQRHTLNR